MRSQLQNLAVQDFARGLLKTTCLTVACGSAAMAATITEGVAPAPADFPNTAPGYLLPVGTTSVVGSTSSPTDPADFFEFQGLTPGSTYTINGYFGALEQESGMFMQVSNSGGTPLGTQASLEGTSPGGTHAVRTGTVPGDGKVVVEIGNFVVGEEGGGGAYHVDLTTSVPTTPAPGTYGEVVVGLGALTLLWSRLRKKDALGQ